jgi:acetyltransferase-like isoleucine patch superfamily enzyme
MHFVFFFLIVISTSFAEIKIGRGTANPCFYDWGDATNLTIGNFCSLASDAKFLLGGEHHSEWVTTYPLFFEPLSRSGFRFSKTKGDIYVGNDVWIGSEACILSGVTIGDGAVIGARAIVTKDVPPYAIAAGNPARVVKYRFDPEIIQKLLKIQWWNWSDEEIKAATYSLLSPNIDEFIEYCRKYHDFLD